MSTLNESVVEDVALSWAGRRLIYLHSYSERFAQGQTWPHGRARCTKAIATESLPEKFSYDEATQTVHVGDGLFKPVALAVWEFEVSGLKVVQSWLGYRMKNRKGKNPLRLTTPHQAVGRRSLPPSCCACYIYWKKHWKSIRNKPHCWSRSSMARC